MAGGFIPESWAASAGIRTPVDLSYKGSGLRSS
jgi:hypothetical protein